MSVSARHLNATPCTEAGEKKKDGREGFSGCDCEFAIEATDVVSVRACVLDSARASCFLAGPFQRLTSNLSAARVHIRLPRLQPQHHADQIQFSHSPTKIGIASIVNTTRGVRIQRFSGILGPGLDSLVDRPKMKSMVDCRTNFWWQKGQASDEDAAQDEARSLLYVGQK